MAKEKDLEKVVKKKIEPIIDSSLHKVLGVSIDELKEDITTKLGKGPFIDFTIDINVPFKKAKKQFKKKYLKKLLELNYGNVSEVARIADVDRRSIHRIIKDAGINVKKIRTDLVKVYEIKQVAVSGIIEDVLDKYKGVIHPVKLDKMYKGVSEMSKDIIEKLPEAPMTLKEAEEEFEKEYLKKALEAAEGNVSKAARKIGLRYETLHRKAVKLELMT